MNRVFKYEIPELGAVHELTLPAGFRVLAAGVQAAHYVVWIEVDTKTVLTDVIRLVIVGTGIRFLNLLSGAGPFRRGLMFGIYMKGSNVET